MFDAYGTLFDFNSAVARHRAVIGPCADALSSCGKQIQYTWLRNGMGAYAPFWQVTGEALDCLAAHGIADPGVREGWAPGIRRSIRSPKWPAMLDDLAARGQTARHPVQRQPRDAETDGRGGIGPRRSL